MIFYLSMIKSQEDKDKFEYIYTNYRYTMLYEARQVLKDEHMAEDAVHESFIKIINRLCTRLMYQSLFVFSSSILSKLFQKFLILKYLMPPFFLYPSSLYVIGLYDLPNTISSAKYFL